MLPPTCRTWSPTGDINFGIFTEGNLLLATFQPSTWGNQRGARSHREDTQNVFTLSFSGLDACYYCINIIVSLFSNFVPSFSRRLQEKSKVVTCCPEKRNFFSVAKIP